MPLQINMPWISIATYAYIVYRKDVKDSESTLDVTAEQSTDTNETTRQEESEEQTHITYDQSSGNVPGIPVYDELINPAISIVPLTTNPSYVGVTKVTPNPSYTGVTKVELTPNPSYVIIIIIIIIVI